jgi:hypothetical protein
MRSTGGFCSVAFLSTPNQIWPDPLLRLPGFFFTVRGERHTMALYRVRPTQADIEIANAVSAHASPEIEEAAEVLTWGADEHLLCALAAGWWLYCRSKSARHRRDSDHILLTTIAVTIIPHGLKAVFDQERPDRLTVRGHLHGMPLSGKRLDAFPSGHAVHVGALASAATVLTPAKRNLVWCLGAGLVLTRIVLLAHWMSDVVAGLAIGVLIERCLRFWTGYGFEPQDRSQPDLPATPRPRRWPGAPPAWRGFHAPGAPR